MLHTGRMRLFGWVLMVLAAGCGDNLEAPAPAAAGGEAVHIPDVTAGPTAAARYLPEVCKVAHWTVPPGGDAKLALSIASVRGRTALLAVPTVGGTMTGFTIDERMAIQTTPAPAKIAIDSAFTAVSASMVNSRIVSAAVVGDAVLVHLFGDDLTNPEQLLKLPGTALGEPAVMSADLTQVLVTGGSDGVTMTGLDDAFQIGETTLVAPSAPITALATTQYGDAILAAWTTTDHRCHVADLGAFSLGATASTNGACDHVHIASDLAHDSANVVFESNGAIWLTPISHLDLDASPVLLRPDGRAPQIAFDGERYWVSYLDPRGQIVAGFLDEHAQLTSMAVFGTHPADDAYELALIDGLPWVFSFDLTTGYSAHQLCAVPQ